MATKAQKFKAEQQRKGGGASKKKKQKRAAPKKAPASRNESKAAARKASFALEGSPDSGQPSRKSTRKSANRAKPDSQLKRRETRRVSSPKRRAARYAT